ncbi:hypothetical protein E2320_014426 [Naja naja]|nr:hypothetical protein E2320_014426 [Naja naja]
MEPKSRSPEGERVRKSCSDDFSKCTEMEHLGWKLSQEIKLESFRGMQQPWKTQWQDFLKTLPCPHVGWEEDSEMLASVPWDDPKAFLASFEQVAHACQWPRGEWEPSQEVIAKSALAEERMTLNVDQEGLYKDIKQDNNGVIHLLGKFFQPSPE